MDKAMTDERLADVRELAHNHMAWMMGSSHYAATAPDIIRELLRGVDDLRAEIDRLKPLAVIGAAVERMGPEARLAHYPRHGSPLRWYIETWGWKVLGVGDTLRDALADAGLVVETT